ncbi:uncharacterized protein MKK02DRAFT_32130 [Dioszegia hungarica]|uniref:Uncharacterized protein n=1 Tax=Dioszegia hungarica TaxID=4972 RepID=A0AA38LTX6_9TREE|nr:uncharacterized protein MKK02DRAFT_32130 [Dioszegia hungarica]KAI9637242.1 hypothetical protein MKK02DRAFT_32130 [Dioszegia hungarica]
MSLICAEALLDLSLYDPSFAPAAGSISSFASWPLPFLRFELLPLYFAASCLLPLIALLSSSPTSARRPDPALNPTYPDRPGTLASSLPYRIMAPPALALNDATVYCALCAVPCLSQLPPSPSCPLHSTARTTITDRPSSPTPELETPGWLSALSGLRVTTHSPPPPIFPQPIVNDTPTPLEPPPDFHQVTLHEYCLSAAQRLSGQTGGGRIVQLWGLPKWVGWTDWGSTVRETAAVAGTGKGQEGMGEGKRGALEDEKYWLGSRDQLERLKAGQTHYLPVST